MPEFWIEASKYGFGTVAMVVMAMAFWKFFDKRLWPIIIGMSAAAEKRNNELSAEFRMALKEQRDDFLRTLSTMEHQHEENHARTYESQREALLGLATSITRIDARLGRGGRSK